MFLKRPAPFTLKVKSRIAEILLLRKHDAAIISNNYPNIWRNIHNKSYHNLVSIKKLTFRILKRYYNTHFYNKKKIFMQFENSSKSLMSFMESPNILSNKSKKFKLVNGKKNNHRSSKALINNKLVLEKYDRKGKRKNTAKTLDNKRNLKNDSLISNTIHSSNFKFTQSLSNSNIKEKKNWNKTVLNIIPKDSEKSSKDKIIIQK